MKNVWTIAWREWTATFVSPIAYVYLVAFLALTSWLFFRGFFVMGQADLRSLFGIMPWMFLFFVPAVAMGKWAEERRAGTLEVLRTLPIRDVELVLGKFFACLGLLAVAIFLTLPIVFTVALVGDLDWGPVIGGYVGLLFMGGTYVAMCLVASMLTQNQIVAFIIGVMICFLAFVIGTPLVVGGKGGMIAAFLAAASVSTHFESIARGVVDLRDVLYSFSVIGFFLFLNVALLKTRARRSRVVAGVTVALALVVMNVVASRLHGRLDLTAGRDYTLAPATKNILKNLQDVATLRIYFSNPLPPQLMALERSVNDLVAEFKAVGGKNVQVEYVNPATSPLDEQKAMMLGIPPVELNVIENDRREVAKVYLGMAILYQDQQEVLPVVERAGNLEYELAQGLLKLSRETTPTLGWLAGEEFSAIRQALTKRFDIVSVDPEKPAEIDAKKFATLVVLGEGVLKGDALKAIDQFVTGGGRLVAFIDRYRVAPGLTAEKVESTLVPLLATHGVTIDDSLVLDQANAMAAFTGGMVTYHLPYPYWPEVQGDGFAADLPMVAELKSLVLPWASPLSVASSTEVRQTKVAVTTTPFGVVTPADAMPSLGPEEARQLLTGGGRGIKPLAALVTKGESQIFVVGTSRVVQDEFLRMFPGNALFFENVIDQLSSGEELIGIRSRGSLERPIAVLTDGMRLALRTTNMVLGPVLVLLIGSVVMIARRTRHRTLRSAYTLATEIS